MVGLMGWAVADQQGWRKGPWTHEEDKLLTEYVTLQGEGRWSSVARCAGLNRSGKSCRLRWVNYLRPGLKKGQITPEEEGMITELHALWGNKWSTIARYLPGRTDNEIKNYWRTHFTKKERSARRTSARRKTPKSKPKPQLQVEALPDQPQTDGTNKMRMLPTEVPVSSNNEQSLLVPTTTWMGDACHDQESLWLAGLWNFVDQAPVGGELDQMQIDHYCCNKMALSAHNQATSNNNNTTNNGLSWGGDPSNFYNGGGIF